MSSTNKTLTIELSQYVGTDKPTYLSDYNGDMLKIDNAIAADRDSIATAQSKADGADAKADTNAGAISTLDSQINNDSNGLAKRVTDVEGDVNTIESLIGNGTPTTTDKTIIGAINELDADIPDSANEIGYVNSESGLSATDVQGAIDEVVDSIESNVMGSAVDFGTATESSPYTLPSDGYVRVGNNDTDTSCNVMVANPDGTAMFMISQRNATSATFLKKGMKVWVTAGGTTSGVQHKFYPLS